MECLQEPSRTTEHRFLSKRLMGIAVPEHKVSDSRTAPISLRRASEVSTMHAINLEPPRPSGSDEANLSHSLPLWSAVLFVGFAGQASTG